MRHPPHRALASLLLPVPPSHDRRGGAASRRAQLGWVVALPVLLCSIGVSGCADASGTNATSTTGAAAASGSSTSAGSLGSSSAPQSAAGISDSEAPSSQVDPSAGGSAAVAGSQTGSGAAGVVGVAGAPIASTAPVAGAGAGADAADAAVAETASGKLSFANDVYDQVIRARCGSCHSDGPSFGGLALFPGAETAYANLVSVPAGAEDNYKCKDSGLMRVEPGDPARSLLYLKLTMPTCGSMMPPGGLGGTLTDEQLSLIRDWIMEGAAP